MKVGILGAGFWTDCWLLPDKAELAREIDALTPFLPYVRFRVHKSPNQLLEPLGVVLRPGSGWQGSLLSEAERTIAPHQYVAMQLDDIKGLVQQEGQRDSI